MAEEVKPPPEMPNGPSLDPRLVKLIENFNRGTPEYRQLLARLLQG